MIILYLQEDCRNGAVMMKKRILSFLLSVCMLASVCSGVTLSAFAESLPLEGKVDAAQPQTDEGGFSPAVEAVRESEGFNAGDFTIAPTGAVEDLAAPVVEDVPSLPFEASGASEEVLRETSPALRAPSPKKRADEFLPIETAPAEEVTAELQAEIASGTCGDNLTWELDTTTGMLTISGTGAMTDWSSSSNVPWYSYRSSIKSVTIESGVTSIGNYAFYNCSSLTSVTIPDSVTSIGQLAFSSCSRLTSITVLNGNTAYASQDGVLFNKDKTTLIQCPEGKTGAYTIPDSVTTIGVEAFHSCDSLTSVTIPDSVTSIEFNAFSSCDSLTSVTIGNSVTTIGYAAFSSCTSLTNITVADGNTAYASQDGVLFNKDKTTLIQCPGGKTGAYTIPNSVTSIGTSAFEDCDSLTSVTIPDSVTSIGYYAFSHCYRLTSITIPDSVTSIGYRAFFSCYRLTRVTIPDSVTAISDYAFYWCDSLTSVIYCGTEEQWNSISIGGYNDPLKNAARTYHSWENAQTVTPATCTAAGEKLYTCSVCGTTKTETAPALGHKWNEGVVTAPATCEGTGTMTYTCSHDASHVYTEAIPELGHNMELKQRQAPTKETEGLEVYLCSRCGLTKNTVLPKLGADLGDLNGDGVINSKDVTLLRRYLAGGYSVTLTNELIADVNKDGVVNAKDVTILRRFLAGGYGVVLD